MGWNSWNKFACNVSEDMIRNMADAMVKSGMKDAGYVYVNIDDCWQVSRDANANIVADPQRFPHGMKAVGDYIHSLGLKFGVYSDAGSKTVPAVPEVSVMNIKMRCSTRPGASTTSSTTGATRPRRMLKRHTPTFARLLMRQGVRSC